MSEANLLLRIKANADQAVREIKTVEGATEKMGQTAKAAGLLAAAGLTTMAARSVSAFAEFDTGMREVFTLMPGMSDTAMTAMTDDVKAFGAEYALTTEQVIPALYQALSAGVPADNVMTFMATAAQTARGGATDLETAVDGLTSAVNAYGTGMLDAQDAADIMFTGVRLGKTTIGDLSDALFQVAPIAAASGVSFDQVVAALAAMSASGVPTRVAATNLRGALVELGKEGTIAADKFKEISGQTFPEFIAAGGQLDDALALMGDYAVANSTTIQNEFGAVEAGMAATVLGVGEGAVKFSGFMDEMGTRAGAAGDAFGTMAEGAGFTMDQMRASAEELMLSIGESLMPVVQELIPVFQELLPPIADLIAPLAEGLLPVVEALAPLLEALGPLGVSVGELFVSAGPMIATMAEALIPVSELITGLVEGLTWMIDAFNGLDPSLKENEEDAIALSDALKALREGIREEDIDKITAAYEDMNDVMGVSDEQARIYYAMIVDSIEDQEQRTAALAASQTRYAQDRIADGQRLIGVEGGLVEVLGRAATAAVEATGPEIALAAALQGTAVAAMAVWEAEQTLANSRRAALDPVFAAIQAEAELITTGAEVARLEGEKKTGTDEYRLALLAQLQAQADLDAAHGKMRTSSGQTLAAIVSLGEKLGWTSEQTQTLTDWVTEFNETTPDEFDAQSAVENLADQMGIAYTDALDLALALGAIDGQTYEYLVRGTYVTSGTAPSGRWVYDEDLDAMVWKIGAARGGFFPSPTWSIVGEEGPELVRLPGGSQVYPAAQSAAILNTPMPVETAGTSVSAATQVIVQGSIWSMDELVTEVETRLARIAARGGDSPLFGGR